MDLRVEFENVMSDWIIFDGRPTWCEEDGIYKEQKWQMAWVAFQRAMRLKTKNE